jgi:hypothetical protein
MSKSSALPPLFGVQHADAASLALMAKFVKPRPYNQMIEGFGNIVNKISHLQPRSQLIKIG